VEKIMIANSKVDEIIVNEMAAKELRIATENYSEAESAFKDAQFKCDKLRQFRQDYVDRFNNEIKQYMGEDTHQGFRSFFSRLDVVIMEQQEIVESARRQLKIQRQLWQECQRKSQALEDASERAEFFAVTS
jgi:flagellar export protein FliJ